MFDCLFTFRTSAIIHKRKKNEILSFLSGTWKVPLTSLNAFLFVYRKIEKRRILAFWILLFDLIILLRDQTGIQMHLCYQIKMCTSVFDTCQKQPSYQDQILWIYQCCPKDGCLINICESVHLFIIVNTCRVNIDAKRERNWFLIQLRCIKAFQFELPPRYGDEVKISEHSALTAQYKFLESFMIWNQNLIILYLVFLSLCIV